MQVRAKKFDWIALALVVSLVLVGWLMVYAASYEANAGLSLGNPAGRQLLFIAMAAVLFTFVNVVDLKFWRTFAYLIYALTLLGLILVLFAGTSVKGSMSWFAIGAFSIQPAEFAKFSTCLAVAGFLSYYRTDLRKFKYQVGALALMAVPAILILLQPDAGSALVFSSFLILLYRGGMPSLLYIAGAILLGLVVSAMLFPPMHVIAMLFLLTALFFSIQLQDQWYWIAGILALTAFEILAWQNHMPWYIIVLNSVILLVAAYRRIQARYARYVVVILPSVAISVALVFGVNHAFRHLLEPHQQDRINVWLRPDQCDPQGSLYNVLQSKIAIGSGGLMGKGFLKGTMTNLNHVPEQTTDFIFSTIGEEQGFVGSAGLIILYAFLLLRIVRMAERMRAGFSRHYAYGILGLLFFHFFINIGMTMGIVPIIGIPLPFVSYGGSSLLAFSLMIAVLFKMDRSRY